MPERESGKRPLRRDQVCTVDRAPAGTRGEEQPGRRNRAAACPDLRGAVLSALTGSLVLLAAGSGFCSPERMKGPDAKTVPRADIRDPETALPKIVLLGAVTVFQRYISPTDGDRCGFTPSCSAFGREAVRREGALVGVLATADRLMRCTIFKRPGAGYLLLPHGMLYDPVENNLLSRQ